MPRTGEPVSTAPGATSDKVLGMNAAIVMGGVRADVEPWSPYRARNYGMFVNGVWTSNAFIGSDTEQLRISHPIAPGSTTDVSIATIDVGDHEQFDESVYVPGGWVKEDESTDAARIRVQWAASYVIDEANGENSLTSVALTGITRFTNCEPDDKFPSTRGRVWYTIEAIGGDRIVRLFANRTLLCSGSRTGDGLVTLAENNNSGVSGTAILTYTADVVPDQAFIVCRWAASYNVHYSTSALSYPRTAEMVVYDRGVTQYVAITPVLAAGSYNYAIQAVGDDATKQTTPSTPSDSPKVVKSPPDPVVHGTPTGTASAITVHWTAGSPECRYMVYYSLVDEPVNLGQWGSPIPIMRPVGADSAILQPIANYAPLDRTTAWNTFVAGIDGVVDALNTAYDSAPTGFVTTIATQKAVALALLQTLSLSVSIPTIQHSERIAELFTALSGTASGFAEITDPTDYQEFLYPGMSTILNGLSMVVDGSTLRYTFTDGSMPWAGTVTADGTEGSNEAGGMLSGVSVKDLVTPLITNRIVRYIIRSTRLSDGIQETSDDVQEIELDSTGAIVSPRPNSCFISSMSAVDLTVTFNLQSRIDDQLAAAATMNVYYGVAPTSPTYITPAGSVAVSSEITGLITGSVTVVFPAPGYYVVAAKSITAGGTPSLFAKETTIWVGTEQPPGPTNIKADVIRAAPEKPVEDS